MIHPFTAFATFVPSSTSDSSRAAGSMTMGHATVRGRGWQGRSGARALAAVVSVLVFTACAITDPGATPTVTPVPTVADATSSPPADASAETPSPAAPSVQSITRSGLTTDGTWILVGGTVDQTPLAVDGTATATINVEPDILLGQAGCNDYEANYAVDGDSVTIDVMGMTEMGCEGSAMALEEAYVAALDRVSAFERVADGQLRLVGARVELVFATEALVDTTALIGTTWTLVALQDAGTTTKPTGDGFVRFQEATMTGSTGCRALDGTWTQQGSEIEFGNLGATGDCTAALQDQDSFVTGIFEDMTATVTQDELVLASREGDRALVYRRS